VKQPPLWISLAAWFAALALLLLAAFSSVLYLGIRSTLYSGTDAELRSRAEGLLALCEWDEEAQHFVLESPAALLPDADPEGRQVGFGREALTWPGQRVLHRSGIALPPLTAPPGERAVEIGFVPTEQGEHLRLCTVVAALSALPGPPRAIVVRIGRDLRSLDATLRSVALVIAGLSLVTALVAVAFALFVRRAIGPCLRRPGQKRRRRDAFPG
jgi:hypothetical protein